MIDFSVSAAASFYHRIDVSTIEGTFLQFLQRD